MPSGPPVLAALAQQDAVVSPLVIPLDTRGVVGLTIVGAQPLGFASLQSFRVYPWQAYVHLVDGLRVTPGMH